MSVLRAGGESGEKQKPLNTRIRILYSTHNNVRSFGLDVEVINLACRQLLYYVCTGALNMRLLLRKEALRLE